MPAWDPAGSRHICQEEQVTHQASGTTRRDRCGLPCPQSHSPKCARFLRSPHCTFGRPCCSESGRSPLLLEGGHRSPERWGSAKYEQSRKDSATHCSTDAGTSVLYSRWGLGHPNKFRPAVYKPLSPGKEGRSCS